METKGGKLPPGGHFAPPSQVPPFSFKFTFNSTTNTLTAPTPLAKKENVAPISPAKKIANKTKYG